MGVCAADPHPCAVLGLGEVGDGDVAALSQRRTEVLHVVGCRGRCWWPQVGGDDLEAGNAGQGGGRRGLARARAGCPGRVVAATAELVRML